MRMAESRNLSAHGLRLRGGLSRISLVACLVILLSAVGAGAWWWKSSAKVDLGELITHRASKGVFTHDVTERGELESSSNVDIRCEVRARNSPGNGVKILQIVPEGTLVKEGDFLVRLDDSALQDELTTQKIAVGTAEAAAAQARNTWESAQLAKQEYEFGTYGAEEETLKSEVLVAEENLSRSAGSLRFSERLARRGYIATSQLEADRFAVAKARTDVKLAQKNLEVLDRFTRVKTLKQLDSDIKTAEAQMKSEDAKLALEAQKLEFVEKQIAKCMITAPVSGQVIYDHEQENFRSADYSIKEGNLVNERRVLIRLPDPKRMQVVAKVAESRIDLIKVAMPATLEIEGLPGVQLTGKVTKVNEYPAGGNWYNSNVKEYATTIEIDNPPESLRPGMTARVAIRVETTPDSLQVPVQSVVESGGKHYCLVLAGGSEIEPREVLLGSTNEKFLIIRDGLSTNDEVLMNPRVYLPKVTLPAAVSRPSAVATAEPKATPQPTASPQRVAAGGPGL